MQKQLNKVEIDETFGMMLVSAVRYALGRQTYIVSDTTRYITLLVPKLDDKTISIMERDIREAGNYGSESIDKPEWMRLLNVLQTEMNNRNINPW